jgi:hypothetical protein
MEPHLGYSLEINYASESLVWVGKWLMSFDARVVHVGTMMMFHYVFVLFLRGWLELLGCNNESMLTLVETCLLGFIALHHGHP